MYIYIYICIYMYICIYVYIYIYIYIHTKRTPSSNIPCSEHNSFNLVLIKSSAPSYFSPSSLTRFCVFSFITAGSKILAKIHCEKYYIFSYSC